MQLQHLSLYNFRNYRRLELPLQAGVTVLQGGNAQGKTNLLEAIFYLATTRSPRTNSDAELVHWLAWQEEPIPYCRVVGLLHRDQEEERLEIILTSQNGKSSGQRGNMRKQVRINQVNRRALDLVGHMPTVFFRPQDIALVDDGPAVRRRYLDITLCQMDREYCRTLSRYNQLLTRRNALLRLLREDQYTEDQLVYWNKKLVELGTTLTWERYHLLDELDGLAAERHYQLSNGQERLHLAYRPSITLATGAITAAKKTHFVVPFPPNMTRETLAAGFADHLERRCREEIAAGMTLIGPHRDDFAFLIQDRDLRLYGSRGQQRTATLALKLAEVETMTLHLGEMPLLLLDDVMAEFDGQRQSMVLSVLTEAAQVLVTTTEGELFAGDFSGQTKHYSVQDGQIFAAV